MARLKHPNVLTIYEVGTDGGRDFIAMELVEGGTLDAWLASHPPRADVQAALIAAGRGLAAAHGAGLVHRDFKPHNVLRASDGRVMVTDFGLARGLGEEPGPAPKLPQTAALDDTLQATPSDHVLDSPLTATGALIGTPAYMAPEQFTGAPPDPRTDQFAFAVTAWQALTGKRPFTGETIDELREAASAGKLADAQLPGAVRAVLLRALDADPAKRWPDLDALLAALGRAFRAPQRRARYAITAGALALFGVYLIAGRSHDDAKTAPETCGPAEAEFARAWNPTRGEVLAKIPGRGGVARFSDAFEALRTRWTAAYERACADPTSPTYHSRVGCLLAVRDGIADMVALLPHIDPRVVEDEDPQGMLPSLDGCNAPSPLMPPVMPTDPAMRDRITEIRGRAIMLRTLPGEAQPAATDALVERATAIGWPPVVAEVWFYAGVAAEFAGQPARAVEAFDRGATTAAAARHSQFEALSRLSLLEASVQVAPDPNDTASFDRLDRAAATAITSAGEAPILRAWLVALEASRDAAHDQPEVALGKLAGVREALLAEGDVDFAADFGTREVELQLGLGDYEAAAKVTEALASHPELTRAPRAAEKLHRLAGRVAWRLGDLERAHREWDALAGQPRPPDVIRGRVVGPDGAGIANATVIAWTGRTRGDNRRIYVQRQDVEDVAHTAADGSFELHGTPSGALMAEAGELRSAPVAIASHPATIAVAPTRTLTETIVADDDPLTNVDAFAEFAVPNSNAVWAQIAAADRDGKVTLARLPAAAAVFGATDSDEVHRVRARPGATQIGWPALSPLEVIVRGARDRSQVWVLRGKVKARTTPELFALARNADDAFLVPLTPVGDVDATPAGRQRGYHADDVHALLRGVADGAITICVDNPEHPPSCTPRVMQGAAADRVPPASGTRRGRMHAPIQAMLVEPEW
jgi:hypothetical protein